MINQNKWTLKGQIALMIGVMGSISLMLSILVINLYSQQILDNQQQALKELVHQEVSTLEENNSELLEEFGLRIQHGANFKKVFKQRDVVKLTELIDSEFFQYYVTARSLSVNKILIYDLDYNLVASSTEGDYYGAADTICPDVIEKAKQRKGSDRIKALEALCYYQGHAYGSIIVPIGSLRVKGYINIISDPVFYLKKLEERLNVPLKIENANNKVVYETEGWTSLLAENRLLFKHDIYGNNKEKLFTMTMHRDISQLNKNSESIRNTIIIIISFVTIISILVFTFIFNKLMVRPLKVLTHHLSLIVEDQNELGKDLPLEGGQEMRNLTACFNTMHSKLYDLYGSLEYIAFTDQLTELPNRSKLQDVLSFHTSLNHRDGTPFVLFMMDLDRFKYVNDTLGHHAGDMLLQEVGARLVKTVRKSDFINPVTEQDSVDYKMDVIARLGGDEFAAILPAMESSDEAIIIAEKILNIMKEPFVIEGRKFNVGVSIGIAVCPNHGDTPDALMQHADVAMYHAKKQHIGFSIFDPETDKNRLDSLTLESDLKDAIANDSLNLVYQPKINLKTNKIVGVEALLRWTHQEHGFVSPDHFIPIAEKTTLINSVSRWVIFNALKQKQEWDKKGIPLTMAINVSTKNLVCKSFIGFLESQVLERNIDAGSVYLEVTETAVMSDPAKSIVTLLRLSEAGFKLSIDDFGTGYSSLSYLKKLPVDEIKIDRSFVMEMEKDENDAIIVQSTIDLAHNMGLSVTAEGVENENVFDQLRLKESDCAQGYFMSRPLSSDDLETWIAESVWGKGK